MKFTVRTSVFATLLSLVLLASAIAEANVAGSQNTANTNEAILPQRKYLKGIRNIIVDSSPIVNHVDSQGKLQSESEMKNQLELSLRRNRIPLLDDNDRKDLSPNTQKRFAQPNAFIRLKVSTINDPYEMRYTYSISVEVYETATLVRSGKVITANVWQISSFGFVDADSAKDKIKTKVDEFLDSFANDYLAANP